MAVAGSPPVRESIVIAAAPARTLTAHRHVALAPAGGGAAGHGADALPHRRLCHLLRDLGTAAAHGGDPLTAGEAEAVVRSALAIARAVALPNG